MLSEKVEINMFRILLLVFCNPIYELHHSVMHRDITYLCLFVIYIEKQERLVKSKFFLLQNTAKNTDHAIIQIR